MNMNVMIRTKTVSFTYREFDNPEELPGNDLELIDAARLAARNAYAPYSEFRVGAAVRLESGLIVTGANVENAAFPSGICAERNALSGSITNHPYDMPESIAIAAVTKTGLSADSVSPCGNCRQVIAEEESRSGKKIRIILSGSQKTLIFESIGDLLPLQFDEKSLKLNLPSQ
jgi:cytidine deaminase